MSKQNPMDHVIIVKDLGLIDYGSALKTQEKYFETSTSIKLKNNTAESKTLVTNVLLFCEHPHVYTLGKSGSKDHLLLNKDELFSKSIEFYNNNRGGDITYHGPGQVVGYPIIDLDQFNPDIKQYMRNLEEVVILTIAEYGIEGDRIDGSTGVWLDVGTKHARKICAFGVKTSRWITMHGWALNVNTDLNYFNYIVPCGIADKGVTSLQKELGKRIDEAAVKEKLMRNFGVVFEAEMKPI